MINPFDNLSCTFLNLRLVGITFLWPYVVTRLGHWKHCIDFLSSFLELLWTHFMFLYPTGAACEMCFFLFYDFHSVFGILLYVYVSYLCCSSLRIYPLFFQIFPLNSTVFCISLYSFSQYFIFSGVPISLLFRSAFCYR